MRKTEEYCRFLIRTCLKAERKASEGRSHAPPSGTCSGLRPDIFRP